MPDTSNISGDVSGFTTVNNDGIFDAGLVIPAFSIDSVLTLNYEMLLGDYVTRQLPLGQTADLPGNIYAPTQTELLFVTIAFAPYMGLHVETNKYHDLFCLAGNIPLTDMLDLLTQPNPDLADAVGLLNFTNVGITQDHYITGDTVIDFSLTNDTNYNLTINVDNTPLNSDVYLVTVADIDELSGLGRLVPMGVSMVEGGTPSSEVLSTIDQSGEFAAYDIVAGAAITDNLSVGITTQVQRSGLSSGSTATLDSFFDFITGMTQVGDHFSFTSPENSVSPEMNIQVSAITLVIVGEEVGKYQWDIIGEGTSFDLPDLPLTGDEYPLSHPALTPEPDSLYWEVSGYGLTLASGFDYNNFAFEDIISWLTHFSFTQISISYTNLKNGELSTKLSD